MDSPTRSIVRRALDELKPYLASYVTQSLADTPAARRAERSDVSGLLASMLDNWSVAFARRLPSTARHYVHELKDVRNRWAHEEPFTADEARRAADTARLLAKAIGAPGPVMDALGKLAADGEIASAPALPTPPQTHATAAPTAGTRRRAVPRVDAHGVIINAEELTADEVVMRRVLCPACRKKVFEEWSAGWDAHAEFRCRGLTADTSEGRKAEFREQFGHLFRGEPRPAKNSSQRATMREIWARCRCDEACAEREYAAAEHRGEVGRASNRYGLSAEAYARALLADGLKKGWLRPCSDTRSD